MANPRIEVGKEQNKYSDQLIITFKWTDTREGRYVMFVENNAVLKHKFQRLHMTVVNSVSAARIIDFLFQEKVLGEDEMYRSVHIA